MSKLRHAPRREGLGGGSRLSPRAYRIRAAAAAGLGAAGAVWLAGGVVWAAPAAGASTAVINVTVNATGATAAPVVRIPVSLAEAPQNLDVHDQSTTIDACTAQPFGSRSCHLVLYSQIGGMSFAQLASLAGVATKDLLQSGSAVIIGLDGDQRVRMSLTQQEVTTGFSDPCRSAAACTPGNPADTMPNFAVVEPSEDGIGVVRPMRYFGDHNGDDQLVSSIDGSLDVTFNLVAGVLAVGPASQSATSVPVGGTVRFGAPTSVVVGKGPDTNPLTYSWTFGDGQTATGATAQNTYTEPGLHSVFATVTDSRSGSSGVSKPIVVAVNAPEPPPAFVPYPPPPPRPPTHPPAQPPAPVRPVPSPPVTQFAVDSAPPPPPAPPPIKPRTPAKLKLSTDTGGGGAGSGGGSGNGKGTGAGGGAKTGLAGGTGKAASGVGAGGSPTGAGTTSQTGSRSTGLHSENTNGLVGVLIDPSGGAIPLGAAVSNATSRVAAAARALAGGGRSGPVSWLGWLLGTAGLVLVVAGRSLAEYEPRAAYRSLGEP